MFSYINYFSTVRIRQKIWLIHIIMFVIGTIERNIKMTEIKHFKRQKNDQAVISTVLEVKIDDIRPNRAQPRAEFDNNSIIRLSDSIRRYGILQPLTVRKADNSETYQYELIAGERRLRAARLLGYNTVPCIVVEADEKLSAELAIIENLLREDLNMFEQAYGFRQLIENYGLTQDEVARKMSLSQSAVANKLRLLKLSYEEQRLIVETGLTERHARALLRVEKQETRIEIIKFVSSNKLNVQKTEEFIENLLNSSSNDDKITESQLKRDGDAREKSLNDLISNFKRKVESIKKLGKDASISVVEGNDAFDVHIVIAK